MEDMEGYKSSSSTRNDATDVVPVVTQEDCSKHPKPQQQQDGTKNDEVPAAAVAVNEEAKAAAAAAKEVMPPQTTTMNGDDETAPKQPQPHQQAQNDERNDTTSGGVKMMNETGDVNNNDGDDDDDEIEGDAIDVVVGYSSRLPTPSSQGVATATGGATDGGATTSERKRFKQHRTQQQQQHQHHHYQLYGIPISVKEGQGRFPQVGSTLGPFFCLGQLGKGTFSSIHKCINLEFFRRKEQKQQEQQQQQSAAGAGAATPAPATTEECRRLAAAKVELSAFAQSGVLESEAAVLEFLYKSTPKHTVPMYMGHFKSTKYAALVMEYLPGEDMHQLREKIMIESNCRRLNIKDAVYLTADVMLPLLQRMHEVGIVHRDVKPSNCVRSSCGGGSGEDYNNNGLLDDPHYAAVDDSSSPPPHGNNNHMNGSSRRTDKAFCLVDFGLSKSIVVPADFPFADKDHIWEGKDWLKPQNYTGAANYRIERSKADFRGTSMYASLRVHQLKDYCPRDDVWSVLYVFCDLVSGGLPWMSYAANRNRDMCQKVKERVHGEDSGQDETELLLMGDHYHLASFRRSQKEASATASGTTAAGVANDTTAATNIRPLPEPLKMSQDKKKVDLLRTAFQHLAKIQFWEQPDYDLMGSCIRGFLDTPDEDPAIRPIDWRASSNTAAKYSSPPIAAKRRRMAPRWDLLADGFDPIDSDTFPEAEAALLNDEAEAAQNAANTDDDGDAESKAQKKSDTPFSRLPVEMRFRLEQLAFHVEKPDAVPHHIVLRDWLNVTLPLLYEDWDARKFEDGGHRTSTDGYRREHYLQLLRQCQQSARTFNFFRSTECFFVETNVPPPPQDSEQKGGGTTTTSYESSSSQPSVLGMIKRKIGSDDQKSDFVTLSRALIGLRVAIKAEEAKRSAPPMRISFGS